MKKPNFDFERRERDRAKAAKKATAKATKGQADIDHDANVSGASSLADQSDLPKE